ncbi:hypothetical protein ABK040_009161 [Willaertia magna]
MLFSATEGSFESNSCSAVDCLKKGYLTKRGQKVKNFKKRYFVLVKGFLFYYKDHNQDFDHPLGIISLQNNCILNKSVSEISENNSFAIRTNYKRFILISETPQEKAKWIKSLEQVMPSQYSNKDEEEIIEEKRLQQVFNNLNPILKSTDNMYFKMLNVKKDILRNKSISYLSKKEENKRESETMKMSSSVEGNGSGFESGFSDYSEEEFSSSPTTTTTINTNDQLYYQIVSKLEKMKIRMESGNKEFEKISNLLEENYEKDRLQLEIINNYKNEIEELKREIEEINYHKKVLIKEVKKLREQQQ